MVAMWLVLGKVYGDGNGIYDRVIGIKKASLWA